MFDSNDNGANFDVNYTVGECWQLPQPKEENETQRDVNEVLAKQAKLITLQQEYIEEIDRYYSKYPPFKRSEDKPLKNQDILCYLKLIRQCLYSNNTYLLRKWGIDYIKQEGVLAETKKSYKDSFEKYSNPRECSNLHIGEIAAFYFKFLFDNFPND